MISSVLWSGKFPRSVVIDIMQEKKIGNAMLIVPKRQCFVGLFDILGFSNIVKNDQLEKVWKSYIELKSSTTFIKENLES